MLSRSNTGPLLVNERQDQDDETPAWVGRFLRSASIINLPLVQFSVMMLLAGLYSAVAYLMVDATIAAGYARTMPCGFRASLFFAIGELMSFVDFVATLFIMRDKDLPNPWDSTKVSLAAVQKSVGEIFPIVVVSFIIQLGPVIAWIWTAIDHFICPMVLQITGYFIQNIFIACTYNFWTAHNELVQINFTRRLTTGELTYEQAVAEYALVNKYRKAMSRALASASWSFQLYMLMMAVVLYDFEIRPWGGWHFALIYVMYAISLVLQLSPWFALHEWPNELCRELMESTELAWSPSDRSNFATLVTTTKVPIKLFDFEMTPGLHTGVPLVFFGWFLYMTELKQFHGFTGFPFDQICFNVTAEEEGGGGHHHG